jgi:NAD+ kinase
VSEKIIGIVAHSGKPGVRGVLDALLEGFRGHGIRVLCERKTADISGGTEGVSIRELGASCDLIVVLGGDGTILQVLHDLGDALKPLFGINLGRLGFLTCVGARDCARAVEAVAAGSYLLSRRSLLCVEVERRGEKVAERTGLNDAVVSRGELSRIVRLGVRIDGAHLTDYSADGLVVATPTGSTAYSLSAGGPIIVPESDVFVVTPICPHVLTNRSVIVGDASLIEIRAGETQRDIFLTVDGQELIALHGGDTVSIRKSSRELMLAMLPGATFFEVLRQKLDWSGSAV